MDAGADVWVAVSSEHAWEAGRIFEVCAIVSHETRLNVTKGRKSDLVSQLAAAHACTLSVGTESARQDPLVAD